MRQPSGTIASKRRVRARRRAAAGSSKEPGTRKVSWVAPAPCSVSTAPARRRSTTRSFHRAATTATCARGRASLARGRPAPGMRAYRIRDGGDRRSGAEGRHRLHRRRDGEAAGAHRAPGAGEPRGARSLRRRRRRRPRPALLRVPARARAEHVDPSRFLALHDRALLPGVRHGDPWRMRRLVLLGLLLPGALRATVPAWLALHRLIRIVAMMKSPAAASLAGSGCSRSTAIDSNAVTTG